MEKCSEPLLLEDGLELRVGSVIDMHVHVWDKRRPQRPYPWTPDPHPVEALVQVLDDENVAAAVHVTPVMDGWDNTYGLQAACRYRGRLAVFGHFDPSTSEPERALRAWMENEAAAGVRVAFYGLRAHALEEGAFDAFWAAAERLQTPVAVFAPAQMKQLLRVVDRYPSLRLIVDHLGLRIHDDDPFGNLDILREFATYPHVAVKISGLVEVSSERFPFRDVHGVLDQARDWFGVTRLVWASNYPVVTAKCSYRESLAFVRESAVFDEPELADVLGGTARRILALE